MFFSIRRSRLAIVSFILLLTGVYQVSLIFNFPGSGKSANRANTINLISFNTGNADTVNAFNSRKEVFENELFNKSDIICLQEFLPKHEKGIDLLEHFKNKINVHIVKTDEQFYNGLILEHSDKHLILFDRVVGKVFVFYSEIKKLDNFKEVGR